MNKLICFADNKNTVEIAFKDYMNHYLSEQEKREGYMYDKSVEFSVKEEKVNKLMMGEISKLAGLSVAQSNVSPEMMAGNPMFRWASFAVVNSLIDMIAPEVIDRTIGIYTETRNGAMGDSFNFEVQPNDLFYISKAGRDQRTVEFQKQFPGQTSVTAENREITVAVNFYKVLCKKESLAKFVTKAILSLEAQITREVYLAFDKAMGELPSTPLDQKLNTTGWDASEAIRIAQTVSSYNAGAEAVFMGTKLALKDILPQNANYRYDIDSDYVKVGHVRNFMGFDTLEMRQIANYKKPYTLGLKDDRIYIISPSSQKPVKLCYEGSSMTNTTDFNMSADLTETTTIKKSYGIGIATNAIAGIINLNV